MRKMNLLFGALALGLGVIVGTVGVSLLTNTSSPTSFISKLRGQDNIQTVNGLVDATQTSPLLNPLQDEPSEANALYSTNPDSILNQAEQQIIADYKQDIGTFFGAWKSADMNDFRLKLAKAYTGELLEKHARRAEEFLGQGIGLDVTQITFDQVDVESSDANTATLRVNYRYKARDYNLTEGTSFGEEHEQNVQLRANLLKQNSRWVITGESPIL